jgi:hypothetical protein
VLQGWILFTQAFDTLKTQRGRCFSNGLRACGAGRRKSGKEERTVNTFGLWLIVIFIAGVKFYLAHRLMK